MILVSGAAGKTGLAIIRRVKQVGHPIRALIRHAGQAERVREAGADETVVGDMSGQRSWGEAAAGVRAMYHICPNVHPLEIEIGVHAIRAAETHGVDRFVYHSVLHPQIETMPHHWKKLNVEGRLFESGLNWTILQPASYMQNVLPHLPEILEHGVYSVPYPMETRLGMVDLDDVAEISAAVLTEIGHIGAIYELAGGEVLSQREVAAVFARQLGRSVSAEEEDLDAWRARTTGLGEYAVEALTNMFKYYAEHGFWGSPTVLRHLLGREPTTFSEFVERALAGSGL